MFRLGSNIRHMCLYKRKQKLKLTNCINSSQSPNNICNIYAFSLEEAVYSGIEKEETIEHYRLSQNDRRQANTEEVQRKQRIQTQSSNYSKL